MKCLSTIYRRRVTSTDCIHGYVNVPGPFIWSEDRFTGLINSALNTLP